MDLARSAEYQLRLQHRHNDGTWSQLEPRGVLDPADRDPEQHWGGNSKLYVCSSCDEQVLVEAADDPLTPLE